MTNNMEAEYRGWGWFEVDDLGMKLQQPSKKPPKDLKPYFTKESFKSNIIIVVEGESFPVPKTLLEARADFFKAALGRHWNQAVRMKLKFVTAETFAIFLTWLYTGSLENSPDLCGPALPGHGKEYVDVMEEDGDLHGMNALAWVQDGELVPGTFDLQIDRLVECYVFADFLGCAGFQNATMDLLIKRYRELGNPQHPPTEEELNGWGPPPKQDRPALPPATFPMYNLMHIYDSSTLHSPLRRFLRHFSLRYVPSASIEEASREELVPEAFVKELRELGKTHSSGQACEHCSDRICLWHTHPEGYECPVKVAWQKFRRVAAGY